MPLSKITGRSRASSEKTVRALPLKNKGNARKQRQLLPGLLVNADFAQIASDFKRDAHLVDILDLTLRHKRLAVLRNFNRLDALSNRLNLLDREAEFEILNEPRGVIICRRLPRRLFIAIACAICLRNIRTREARTIQCEVNGLGGSRRVLIAAVASLVRTIGRARALVLDPLDIGICAGASLGDNTKLDGLQALGRRLDNCLAGEVRAQFNRGEARAQINIALRSISPDWGK